MLDKVILKVAYDGTEFHGWQVQKNIRTVQQVLANAWEKLTGQFEYPHGSGRTDAGVHALGQIASFTQSQRNIAPMRYATALNSYLPKDVTILQSSFAPACFDVRRSALSRTYFYHIHTGQYPIPQLSTHSLFLRRTPLLLARLNQLAQLFVGQHNFQAFASAHDQNRNKVRTVHTSSFIALSGGRVRYQISANAFLMNMVRSIIGSILHFHDDPAGQQKILHALKTGEKHDLGPTAPACGLTLMQVDYPLDQQYWG